MDLIMWFCLEKGSKYQEIETNTYNIYIYIYNEVYLVARRF